MKKRILCAVFFVIMMLGCMTGCGNGTKKSDNIEDIINSMTDDEQESATSASNDESIILSPESAVSDDNADENKDYLEAKAKIDAFHKNLGNYEYGVITADKDDCWLHYESYITKQNGGGYDGWHFYVTNEETKQYTNFGQSSTGNKEGSGLPLFDHYQRVGFGTFKIYAIYENVKLGVFFYADETVVLNESTVFEYNRHQAYRINLNELISEDMTIKTYQIERDSDDKKE